MGVFDAAVVGPGGEALAPHGREWGDAPTDSADPLLQPELLRDRPDGRRDSAVGRSPPDGRLLPRLRGAGKPARRPARAPRRRVEARQAAAVEGAVCSLGAAGGVDAATPPVLRVLVDARPRAGVVGALEAGRTAQAGRDSRAQGRRGPRLVPRPVPGGLGLRGDTLARLRRAGGGPGLPRPYRPRKDPRSHRARR